MAIVIAFASFVILLGLAGTVIGVIYVLRKDKDRVYAGKVQAPGDLNYLPAETIWEALDAEEQ